jgi:flagellin
MISVNTNTSAMIALQNLNATTTELSASQDRLSTGLKVSSAKDNASVYAIAQNMRGDVGSMDAITSSLNRASSITDVALTAGQSISDLLVQMKEKAVAANDASIDTSAREALNEDFKSLRSQITTILQNANFDGANLLNGSLSSGLNFLASPTGASSITLGPENMSLSGSIITLTNSSALTSLSSSTAALSMINASLQNVNLALARLGSEGTKVDGQLTFISKLQDSFNTGIGNLVDDDMAAESAKLQSLQVKQQLGTQALSIANSQPQTILSLFKG